MPSNKRFVMKIFLCNLLLLAALVSCDKGTKSDVDGKAEKSKNVTAYQMEVYQKSPDDFKIIYLNKLNGDVHVRDANGSWYNAQTQSLKAYDTPAYSMRVFDGANGLFQVALSNDITGAIYIRSYANSWYEASRVQAVE